MDKVINIHLTDSSTLIKISHNLTTGYPPLLLISFDYSISSLEMNCSSDFESGQFNCSSHQFQCFQENLCMCAYKQLKKSILFLILFIVVFPSLTEAATTKSMKITKTAPVFNH